MINLLVKLSESDKRVLIALLLVLIILLILFGYLVKLIKFILAKQAAFVDTSMYDIVDANMVSTPKEFRKVSFEKNRRKFYFEAIFPFTVMALANIIVVILLLFPINFGYQVMGNYFYDLRLSLNWDNCFVILLDWIPALQHWPAVTHSPTFYFNEWQAWVSYIYLIAMIYGITHFTICVCAFASRNYRTIMAAHDVFDKDLKKLADAKNLNNVHTKKPTEEMKEAVADEVK